ncbi:MAG: type II toxin-antitoxin system HipA family toxin [Pigmentiphaga sp.]
MANRARRPAKRVEPDLAVLVDVRGSVLHAGDLRLEESHGQFQAQFRYTPTYLDQALLGDAFALDPINLPLKDDVFTTTSRYHRLGALFDAAPDAWGRTIMAKDEKISPTALTETQVLLKGRGGGVGAIVFANPSLPMDLTHPRLDLPGVNDLERIFQTITAIESGTEVSEALRAMLMSSWDMGGARPKAVVRDETGTEWIAKFPRAIDTYSRQRVEWANLEMARAIGMTVPKIALHKLAGGDCALLVKRFDRTARGHHRHYLSAVSLISPPSRFDKHQLDTAYGASIFSYERIADVIRRISSNVTHDIQELFARMVLNILVHNTDDHLKNTGFLMTEEPGFRYRLSPLFDVVTQEGTLRHLLHLGPGVGPDGERGGRLGTLENARAGARLWGLKTHAVEEIIIRVQKVLARRQRYYEAAGMKDGEIGQVERWLSPEIAAASQPISR